MIVRRTIDKDELKELPKTVFPGRIYVIQSEAETEKAVAYLQSRPVIGIDSETRPSFTKGQSHKVALLQISSEECCFLFRLNMTGLTQPLVDLLENPAVIKVGLSPNKAVSNYRTMCVNSEYKTKVCKRFTPSYSKKKYPNHNACPTGKLMY
mgnify:CR=1 FL=1